MRPHSLLAGIVAIGLFVGSAGCALWTPRRHVVVGPVDDGGEYLEIGTHRYVKGEIEEVSTSGQASMTVRRLHRGRAIGEVRMTMREHEKRTATILEPGDVGFRRMRLRYDEDSSQMWIAGKPQGDTGVMRGREVDVIATKDGVRFEPVDHRPLSKAQTGKLTSTFHAIEKPKRGRDASAGGARPGPRRIHVGDGLDESTVPMLASTRGLTVRSATLTEIKLCGDELCGVAHVEAELVVQAESGELTCPLVGDLVFRARDARVLSVEASGPVTMTGETDDGSGDTIAAEGRMELHERHDYR